MNFIISASTDLGGKSANQDSMSALVLNTPQGPMAFAVLCDGMGGLEHGELASAAVVRAFRRWALTVLPVLCREPLEDRIIRRHWETLITDLNNRIQQYSVHNNTRMGTTVAAILLTQKRYYIVNMGDSRVYELTDRIRQLTKDHSWVAREVEAGRISPEEAEHHPKRNVLTQCIGAPRQVFADMFFGTTKKNAVYLLCSDGFRHEITGDEIFEKLCPGALDGSVAMKKQTAELIEMNKQRGETDNISVALIRSY